MTHRVSFKDHAKAVLVLGLPLAGSHLAQFAVNVVDVIMMGWYGVDALAAVVLGTTVFFLLFLFGGGLAHAVMPMVAHAVEAGYPPEARRATRMGLWAVTIFATLALPIFLFSAPILQTLGQDAELSRLTGTYLLIVGFQLFPALWIMVLKSFLSSLERAQFILFLTVGMAVMNTGLNWVLIFGKFGFPELGVQGCALASMISNYVGALVLGLYVARVKGVCDYVLFGRLWRPDLDALRRVVALGWPISMTMLAEVGLFSAAAFMFGWIGVNDLAGHGIALQIASATFLFHLGLSNAATVRAGRAVGRKDAQGLRDGALVASVLSLAVATVTALIFLTIPEVFVSPFLNPQTEGRDAIISIGASLLMIAGVFQIADSAQVIAMGLLRGVQDTRVPMLIAGVSYWVVGLTASYVLGFLFGFGGAGIWWGLVLGLTVAAVLLSWRFWRHVIPRALD